jgi:bifunctional DNA-binding transcriptional regulator/antitoxin component of YhaV-PrlF toxin-antitoxin module
MATLTITARGQVTLKKDLLQHMGIEPGGKVEVDMLPGGRVALKAARPKGSIMRLSGMLAGKTSKVATIEEMNEAAAAGWAGQIED